jgi:hypothetical protein
MIKFLHRLAIALMLAVFLGGAAAAQVTPNTSIKAFYGTFVGQTVFESDKGLTKRDLNVTIAPNDGGFSIRWTTITQRPDGSFKRKQHTVAFRPTRRKGIYSSAMQVNKFGAEVPLDPMSGDPYVWARLDGATLSVYAMLITDDGGYEMQTYERTIAQNDMRLEFRRIRNGHPLKKISARLKRVKDK